MKKLLILIFFVAVVVGGYLLHQTVRLTTQVESAEESLAAEPEPVWTFEVHQIEGGETITSVMEDLGFGYSEALAMVDATADVFDFTTIRVGRQIKLVYEDGQLLRLEYEPNVEDVVKVDLVSGDYQAIIEPIAYEIELNAARVTIADSMFVSGLEAGLPEVLILDLAEVLAWEIDFATQVQSGDSFQVLYEERYRDGQPAGVGRILAVEFNNAGYLSSAFWFDDGENGGYFDAEGNSLVRPFLKAPLVYSRISSGYTTARFHPITGQTTPHLAIDYAASIGTPIMAVADGTIIHAAYTGGYGNYINIRHNEMYQTNYAHLSAYAVSVGDAVKQGEVIGYVGSTGWSTGPHLHYEVVVNGEKVNPLEVEFPKGDSIAEDRLDDFYAQRDEWRQIGEF